jgi:hypothetical protein
MRQTVVKSIDTLRCEVGLQGIKGRMMGPVLNGVLLVCMQVLYLDANTLVVGEMGDLFQLPVDFAAVRGRAMTPLLFRQIREVSGVG